MTLPSASTISPESFSPLNPAPGLPASRLKSGGVPAPVPVIGPDEHGNTDPDDPQTLRAPIPIIPSGFFVGVPGALGTDARPDSPISLSAVTAHIRSRSTDSLGKSLLRPAPATSPAPAPPPSTPYKPPGVENQYHTVTVPCTREANATEIGTILQAPSRLLGHKFTPSHGQEIWEVVEVSVGTTRAQPAAGDDRQRTTVPLRLQTPPELLNGEKKQAHKPSLWKKEPEVKDAFADDEDDESKPVPQLVGTGEVVVRFRGYEGSGEEHYMLVRDFVDMLRDRTALIVELE